MVGILNLRHMFYHVLRSELGIGTYGYFWQAKYVGINFAKYVRINIDAINIELVNNYVCTPAKKNYVCMLVLCTTNEFLLDYSMCLCCILYSDVRALVWL